MMMKTVCKTLDSNHVDPWSAPSGASAIQLARFDGAAPRLATTVFLWRTKTDLCVLFDMEDDRVIVAPLMDDDSPIWQYDVVEVFLAPERPEHYFELELSPMATRFSARIHSPQLRRETMTTDLDWTPPGFAGLVRRQDAGETWRTQSLLIVPFDSLGRGPDPGESWSANFYRIDRAGEGSTDEDEFSAWSPTSRDVPDFHRPDHFGEIVFE